jgi:hypothetical protein
VDLSGRRLSHFLFTELPSGQKVDLALVNTDETRMADVTFQMRNDQGMGQGSAVTRQIPARGRFTGQAQDLFPGVSGAMAQ